MIEFCRTRYETELPKFQEFAKQMHFNQKEFFFFPDFDDESELKVVVIFDFTESQSKYKDKWVFQLIYNDCRSSPEVQIINSTIKLKEFPHSYGRNYISVGYVVDDDFDTLYTLRGIFRWIVLIRSRFE
jgi:hypothetical protein